MFLTFSRIEMGTSGARRIIALASGAAASGLLMWLFKEWLSTRLKASIQHEYDRKLEAHKAQAIAALAQAGFHATPAHASGGSECCGGCS